MDLSVTDEMLPPAAILNSLLSWGFSVICPAPALTCDRSSSSTCLCQAKLWPLPQPAVHALDTAPDGLPGVLREASSGDKGVDGW